MSKDQNTILALKQDAQGLNDCFTFTRNGQSKSNQWTLQGDAETTQGDEIYTWEFVEQCQEAAQ